MPDSPLLTPWHDLDRLARAAQTEIAASGMGDPWVIAGTLIALGWPSADAEFVAACSPERILSLLDAAARGAADTARLTNRLETVEAVAHEYERAEESRASALELVTKAREAWRIWAEHREWCRHCNEAVACAVGALLREDAVCAHADSIDAARAVPPALDGPA